MHKENDFMLSFQFGLLSIILDKGGSIWWFILSFLHYRSFYVGDAAGRANDHSDADIKFAEVFNVSKRKK